MLIDSIYDWNPWWENKTSIVEYIGKPREELGTLIRSLEDEKITIISGVRRAGKTTLMYQSIAQLLDMGINPKNILFLGLEDPAFIELDLNALIFEYRKEHAPKGKTFIFLDEIQSKENWERILRKELDTHKQNKIVISGSTSALVGGKYSGILTGRNLTYNIRPLSFRDFISFINEPLPKNKIRGKTAERISGLFRRYLEIGGFPEVVLQKQEFRKKTLNQYFSDIIYRDIIHLHNANARKIYTLASYLLLNVGNTVTLSSLRRALGLSFDAIKDYLHYLEQAKLFYLVKEFTYSPKPAPKEAGKMKVYCIDVGLAKFVQGRHSRDYGRLAENCVYLELNEREISPGFFRGKKEIDFVATLPRDEVFLINVCMSNKIPDREFDGFKEFKNKYPKTKTNSIILTDSVEDIINNVKLIPIWKWLIEK